MLRDECPRLIEAHLSGALKELVRIKPQSPASSKPAFSISDEIARRTCQLQGARWADAALQQVESEDLAREAYKLSRQLREEFRSEANFLSYWKALRNVQRKT
jgi:hypothetical protein